MHMHKVNFLLRVDMKVTKLDFDSDHKKGNSKCELDYLRRHGKTVREVQFLGKGCTNDMSIVARYCHSLKVIRVAVADLTREFREVLWLNRNLEELCVDSATFDCTDPFSPPTPLVIGLTALRTFVMQNSSIRKLDVFEMLKHPIHLRNLAIDKCDVLSDENVLHLVTLLPSLRAISIQSNLMLTDLCLQHLAQHAGDRLEIARIDIKNTLSNSTEICLKYFCQKCVKLKYLNVNSSGWWLGIGREASIIILGCPLLKTLVCSMIGQSIRELTALLRPDLTIMAIDSRNLSVIFSMKL